MNLFQGIYLSLSRPNFESRVKSTGDVFAEVETVRASDFDLARGKSRRSRR
jgi:hypothetical protein